MYSNLFSNCVYECPTLCVCVCGRVCIFRFGSPFETRFLFLNIEPKSGWQMVLELAVLSLSRALLKRLVCPMHPTMPWRYQHFVFWLSSHHHFSTQRFCLLSLRHLYQSKLPFLRPSRHFWFQLSLASEASYLLSCGQHLHGQKVSVWVTSAADIQQHTWIEPLN